MLSINSRMLIASAIILISFLGITGITLENSFHASAEESLKERLRVHLAALIASAEVNNGTMRLTYALPESRFFVDGSGLYAKIVSNRNNQLIWSSPSMKGITIPVSSDLGRGIERYQYMFANGEPLLLYTFGLTWAEDEKFQEGYTFAVAENLGRFNLQFLEFRKNLWAWLGGVTVILLFVLALILRWGLAPLRVAADDLADIKEGRHNKLHGTYPKELRDLTDNLNALMRTNREHEERYQASLGDLAHSLKTPLAVLRSVIESPARSVDHLQSTVEEQVERMDQIVQYQLQRAGTSGRTALMASVDLAKITSKVVKVLDKVYADKELICTKKVEPGLEFHCQEGDMMELLGNLLDNAYKWSNQRVDVKIGRGIYEGNKAQALLLDIADDGPGIAEEDQETVLTRGGRIDSQAGGHGLGLAMVQDVVALYEGKLEISRAELGGARVRIWLPWS